MSVGPFWAMQAFWAVMVFRPGRSFWAIGSFWGVRALWYVWHFKMLWDVWDVRLYRVVRLFWSYARTPYHCSGGVTLTRMRLSVANAAAAHRSGGWDQVTSPSQLAMTWQNWDHKETWGRMETELLITDRWRHTWHIHTEYVAVTPAMFY
jgi:hypothetical protein